MDHDTATWGDNAIVKESVSRIINAPAHTPSSGTSCHLPPGGGGVPL